MKQPKTSRRVNPTSRRNQKKQRREQEYGPLHSDKKTWTNGEMDILLDGFLVHEWCHLSAGRCFHSELGRTYDSIKSQLWKIATQYVNPTGKPSSAAQYEAICRVDRTGQPFTKRDYGLMDLMINSNREISYERIGKVLGRSEKEVEKSMTYMANNCSGFFKEAEKGETEKDRVFRLMRRVLSGAFEKTLKKLGGK